MQNELWAGVKEYTVIQMCILETLEIYNLLIFKNDKDKKKSRRPNIAYEEEVNSGDGDSQLLPNTRPESSKKQSLIKLQRTPSMAVDEEKI